MAIDKERIQLMALKFENNVWTTALNKVYIGYS